MNLQNAEELDALVPLLRSLKTGETREAEHPGRQGCRLILSRITTADHPDESIYTVLGLRPKIVVAFTKEDSQILFSEKLSKILTARFNEDPDPSFYH